MKTPLFVSFCLSIVTALVSLHAIVRNTSGPVEKLTEQMAVVEKERQRADFRSELMAQELADYRQRVATLIPEAVRDGDGDPATYPLRQLASVVAAPRDHIIIERASGLFEKAKTAFREGDFEGSNHLLGSLVEKFPDSTHVAEAHFLLAEGHFQLKEFSDSASTIERMIEAYPENELTGFALLRLGHIFEVQNRLEDAGDIYRSVLENFKQPDLIKQARTSLRAVTL